MPKRSVLPLVRHDHQRARSICERGRQYDPCLDHRGRRQTDPARRGIRGGFSRRNRRGALGNRQLDPVRL